MKRSLPVVGAFLLAGGFGIGVCDAHHSTRQETSRQAQSPSDEYKVTSEDIARKNPVKSSPEGLSEAKRVFRYDCAMCHGEQGDGKGEIVESMKLTMRHWRGPEGPAGEAGRELL